MQGKRQSKTQGSCKLRERCIARMKVTRDQLTGSVDAQYCSIHHNHEVSLGHLRIRHETCMKIAAQLQQWVTIERIMGNIRNNTMEGITREYLVTKLDVHNVKNQYNIHVEGVMRHKNDLTSVCLGRTEISSKQPCTSLQASRWATTWWYEHCWEGWFHTWNTNTVSTWHAVYIRAHVLYAWIVHMEQMCTFSNYCIPLLNARAFIFLSRSAYPVFTRDQHLFIIISHRFPYQLMPTSVNTNNCFDIAKIDINTRNFKTIIVSSLSCISCKRCDHHALGRTMNHAKLYKVSYRQFHRPSTQLRRDRRVRCQTHS